MNATALVITHTHGGWDVRRTSGEVLASFHGPWAHRRAVGYVAALGHRIR